MKWFAILCLALSLSMFPNSSRAETRYVSDTVAITFRTGPGIDHKILGMLKSGQQVELISQETEWSQIATPSGREGWVLTRFLISEPPSRLVLQSLQQEHQKLTEETRLLSDENRLLKLEDQQLKDALEKALQELKDLEVRHETLTTDSADFINLQKRYKKMSAELAKKTTAGEGLEDELASLRINKNIKWFLSGAGVLIVGFIIGFSARRQRRRSSLF